MTTTATRPTATQRDALTALASRQLLAGASTQLGHDRVSSRTANALVAAGWAIREGNAVTITHEGKAVLEAPELRTGPPTAAPGEGHAAALIEPVDGQLVNIPLDQLHPAADNPREGVGDPDRLADLAASIRTQGILEPLIVVARPEGGWTIVAGHRRHAAAALAEQTDVPCITRTMTDPERVAAMLVENLHRTDLDPLEEARGYKQLRELGWAQTRIATQLGRDQSTVSRRLKLLDLVPTAVEQIRAGHLTLDTAAKLARLQPKTAARKAWQAAYEPRRQWLVVYLGELLEAAQEPSWAPDHALLLHTATVLGRHVDSGVVQLHDFIGLSPWEARKPIRSGDLHPVALAYTVAIATGEAEARDAHEALHWTLYGDGPDTDTDTVALHLAELDRIGCPEHATLADLLTPTDQPTAAAA